MDDTVRRHKYTLDEDQIHTTWYNIIPDLPVPPPPPPPPSAPVRAASEASTEAGPPGAFNALFKDEEGAIVVARLIARINLWVSAVACVVLIVLAFVAAKAIGATLLPLVILGIAVLAEGVVVWALLSLLCSMAANLARIRQMMEGFFASAAPTPPAKNEKSAETKT